MSARRRSSEATARRRGARQTHRGAAVHQPIHHLDLHVRPRQRVEAHGAPNVPRAADHEKRFFLHDHGVLWPFAQKAIWSVGVGLELWVAPGQGFPTPPGASDNFVSRIIPQSGKPQYLEVAFAPGGVGKLIKFYRGVID